MRVRYSAVLASVAAVAFITGCSANHAALLPATALSNDAPQSAKAAGIHVKVMISVPNPSHAASKFVTAATRGIFILVYPHKTRTNPTTRDIASIAAGAPDCAPGKTARKCSIALTIPTPARYDFVLQTYDAAPKNGSFPKTAKLLGSGVVGEVVSAKHPNVVNAVVDGVVANITLELATTATHAIDPVSQPATVQAFDADGNAIITGSYVNAAGGVETISMSADGAAGKTITFKPAQFSVPQPGGVIVTYNPSKLTSAQAVSGFVSVLTATTSAGAKASVELTVAQPQIVEVTLPVANSRPYAITDGPDGAMWFAEGANNSIGRITTAMTASALTQYTVPTAASTPVSITTGPDGALWFGELSGGKIGRATTAGTITEFYLPVRGGTLASVAKGPDANVWFVDDANDQIGKIDGNGRATEYPIPLANSAPDGIAAGPDGALWFTEANGNNIGRITTNGFFVSYPIPSVNSGPEGIVAGPDGALWFAENTAARIGRLTTRGGFREYSLPTASSGPRNITVGPDGAIWFTENTGGKIGRITTNGSSLIEYPLSPASATPFGIATGPDGGIYFTDSTGNKVGRLQ
jgi:virginiamycin B lyase